MRNSDVIEVLYKKHYEQLFIFGLMFEIETQLVKDAINDVFLELCEKPGYLEKARNPLAYLSICVKNKLLKFKKTSGRQVPFSAFETDPELMTDDNVREIEESHQCLQRQVEQAISRLTNRQKEVIQLKFFMEKDTSEIVSITGMNTKTVYNTLSTALKNIRTEVKHGLWLITTYLLSV